MKSIQVCDLYKIISEQEAGNSICIDVRTPKEYKSLHIEGTKNIPLDKLKDSAEELSRYDCIYINCGSGMRSEKACKVLVELGLKNIVNVEGGIEKCKEQGFKLNQSGSAISIIRQVHLTVGLIIMVSTLLSWFISPNFLIIIGFIGLGLFFAGASGTCLLGMVIMKMPWNK